MGASVVVILATTQPEGVENFTFTRLAKNQIRAFAIGLFVFFFLACFDYRKLREYTWFFYIGTIILLLGLYFVAPIHNVRRWYRLPFLPFDLQPSEIAKLVVVITLSWYLERNMEKVKNFSIFLRGSIIVFIPFALILKQPDLGTALVLCPIALSMFYIGGIDGRILKVLSGLGVVILGLVLSIFLGLVSHDEMRPYATKFIKEYQYERLNPNTYHQKAGQTAIGVGHYMGSGFLKSEYTGNKFLPYGFTDSVFPAFAEEFGLVGALLLLSLFFSLIYFSFQVTGVARDYFGRLLASGIAIYIAMHVIVNIGMMCGFLPITGVPLILVTSGGSSVIATFIALGLLQSIYARRFTF
ncbi:MAG: Peptidoglycan glycosyltransferase MrdB [Chlamydiia bacterium]|nr:Peptidoglycan glycosyltransferase MrdB [Chlamydiia bacterium]